MQDMMWVAQSEVNSLISRIDGEFLGVICLIVAIFFFVTIIVSIVTFSRYQENVTLARMHNELISQLLEKGHTPDEVERLVYGDNRWNKIRRVFNRFQKRPVDPSMRPMPPVKQHV